MERDEVLREILALIKDEARDLGHYGDRPSYAARIKQHADAALALLEPAPEPEPQPEPPGPGVAEYERFLRWSAEHAEPGHIYPPTAAVPQDGTLREALERLADKWFAAGWVVATTKTERGVGKGIALQDCATELRAALLASVPEREPDGWMHGRTAAQWRRGEWGGTSFTRSPDGIVDPVPVYIGAAQAAESEGQ
jgi:hypothetical protein